MLVRGSLTSRQMPIQLASLSVQIASQEKDQQNQEADDKMLVRGSLTSRQMSIQLASLSVQIASQEKDQQNQEAEDNQCRKQTN
jgi:hypothetical protein